MAERVPGILPGGLKAFESSLGQEISFLKKFYSKIFA
jgi:hypothetical protein